MVPLISLIATIYWFAHFLIVLPVVGLIEKPIPRPETIEQAFKEKHDIIERADRSQTAGTAAQPAE